MKLTWFFFFPALMEIMYLTVFSFLFLKNLIYWWPIYNGKMFNHKDRFKCIVEALALLWWRENFHYKHSGNCWQHRHPEATSTSCIHLCPKGKNTLLSKIMARICLLQSLVTDPGWDSFYLMLENTSVFWLSQARHCSWLYQKYLS